MLEEQLGGARDTESVRSVPWQQDSAESAKVELVSMACGGSGLEQSWNRQKTKLVGSAIGEKWNSQSVDSPWIAGDTVWQCRETRC